MILIPEPVTHEEIVVPQHIVDRCAEFTRLDPYVNHNTHDELRLLDCYWHNMNYYKVIPPIGWS